VTLGWNYLLSELCAAVAVGQLERLDDLVAMRVKVADIYEKARNGCSWLTAQAVPAGHVHSYWTYVVKLDHPDLSWHEFRREYLHNGGDPMYAAWLPTYLEPVLRRRTLAPTQVQHFDTGLCPVTESIQPRLLQFKTDYLSVDDANRQADALARTIARFQ
jgi:perosamine synthetase